jgi:hypothetical protein
MAGCGHHTAAVRVKTQRQSGGKAALEATLKSATERCENLSRADCAFDHHARSPDDQRHRHRRPQSFVAHIAENDHGRSAAEWNDLKEIAAYFKSRLVRRDSYPPLLCLVPKRPQLLDKLYRVHRLLENFEGMPHQACVSLKFGRTRVS